MCEEGTAAASVAARLGGEPPRASRAALLAGLARALETAPDKAPRPWAASVAAALPSLVGPGTVRLVARAAEILCAQGADGAAECASAAVDAAATAVAAGPGDEQRVRGLVALLAALAHAAARGDRGSETMERVVETALGALSARAPPALRGSVVRTLLPSLCALSAEARRRHGVARRVQERLDELWRDTSACDGDLLSAACSSFSAVAADGDAGRLAALSLEMAWEASHAGDSLPRRQAAFLLRSRLSLPPAALAPHEFPAPEWTSLLSLLESLEQREAHLAASAWPLFFRLLRSAAQHAGGDAVPFRRRWLGLALRRALGHESAAVKAALYSLLTYFCGGGNGGGGDTAGTDAELLLLDHTVLLGPLLEAASDSALYRPPLDLQTAVGGMVDAAASPAAAGMGGGDPVEIICAAFSGGEAGRLRAPVLAHAQGTFGPAMSQFLCRFLSALPEREADCAGGTAPCWRGEAQLRLLEATAAPGGAVLPDLPSVHVFDGLVRSRPCCPPALGGDPALVLVASWLARHRDSRGGPAGRFAEVSAAALLARHFDFAAPHSHGVLAGVMAALPAGLRAGLPAPVPLAGVLPGLAAERVEPLCVDGAEPARSLAAAVSASQTVRDGLEEAISAAVAAGGRPRRGDAARTAAVHAVAARGGGRDAIAAALAAAAEPLPGPLLALLQAAEAEATLRGARGPLSRAWEAGDGRRLASAVRSMLGAGLGEGDTAQDAAGAAAEARRLGADVLAAAVAAPNGDGQAAGPAEAFRAEVWSSAEATLRRAASGQAGARDALGAVASLNASWRPAAAPGGYALPPGPAAFSLALAAAARATALPAACPEGLASAGADAAAERRAWQALRTGHEEARWELARRLLSLVWSRVQGGGPRPPDADAARLVAVAAAALSDAASDAAEEAALSCARALEVALHVGGQPAAAAFLADGEACERLCAALCAPLRGGGAEKRFDAVDASAAVLAHPVLLRAATSGAAPHPFCAALSAELAAATASRDVRGLQCLCLRLVCGLETAPGAAAAFADDLVSLATFFSPERFLGPRMHAGETVVARAMVLMHVHTTRTVPVAWHDPAAARRRAAAEAAARRPLTPALALLLRREPGRQVPPHMLVRAMALAYMETLGSRPAGGDEARRSAALARLLAERALDRADPGDGGGGGGGGGGATIVQEGSAAFCGHAFAWQVLGVLAPALCAADAAWLGPVMRRAFAAHARTANAALRAQADPFLAAVLQRVPQPYLREHVLAPLQDTSAGPGTVSSLLLLAGVAARSDRVVGGGDEALAVDLMDAMCPWVASSYGYLRTVAQAMLTDAWERLGEAERARAASRSPFLARLVGFVRTHKEVAPTVAKLRAYLDLFDPVRRCTLEGILCDGAESWHRLAPATVDSVRREIGHLLKDLRSTSLDYDDAVVKASLRAHLAEMLPAADPAREENGAPAAGAPASSEGAAASAAARRRPHDAGSQQPELVVTDYQKKIELVTDAWEALVASGEVAASSADGRREQLEAFEERRQRHSMVVVASLVNKVPNLAGLSRTAEVFGLERLVVGDRSVLRDRMFKRISVTSEQWLPFDEVPPDAVAPYLVEMRRRGYSVVALEQTANSVPLTDFCFPERTVLVLGREKTGVPVELLNLVDYCVEVPQFGMVRSLNVHVTAAVAIWSFVRGRVAAAAASAKQ